MGTREVAHYLFAEGQAPRRVFGDALCDDGYVVRDVGPSVRCKPTELATELLKSPELSGVWRPVIIRRRATWMCIIGFVMSSNPQLHSRLRVNVV